MRRYRLIAGLIVLIANPALASDTRQSVGTALEQCLDDGLRDVPITSSSLRIPPGLIDGQNVRLRALDRNGTAFAYRRTNPHVVTCGVVLYGRVPPSTAKQLALIVERHPRWTRWPADFWKWNGVAAETTYWGDPRAPGMTGVALLKRRASRDAPTLEVQYHTLLAP